jgi:hypothetical protein
MSDENKTLTDAPTPLFQSVLSAMKMAEQTGADGLTKRAVVLNVLIGAGLIKETDREHIGVIVDLVIYCARHAGDLKAFARSSGCLPCIR